MFQILTPDNFPVVKLQSHTSFGEAELIDDVPRLVSVRATKESFLLSIARNNLINTLKSNLGEQWKREHSQKDM